MGRPSKGLITETGRECARCGLFKEWSEYAKNKNTKATKTGYSSVCKGCHRLAWGTGRTCLDCGTPISTGGIRCKSCAFSGERNPAWKGGERSINEEGYARIYTPRGRMLEHKYVMEELLGRLLFPDETVHHKNGIRDDNEPGNLELWTKAHPPGQRVEDKVAWCIGFLRRYGYEIAEVEPAAA